LESSPNLWAGIGLVRGGAGTALVGDPETVAARIQEYADLGIDTFIFSGYPHLEESIRFAELVFPLLPLINKCQKALTTAVGAGNTRLCNKPELDEICQIMSSKMGTSQGSRLFPKCLVPRETSPLEERDLDHNPLQRHYRNHEVELFEKLQMHRQICRRAEEFSHKGRRSRYAWSP